MSSSPTGETQSAPTPDSTVERSETGTSTSSPSAAAGVLDALRPSYVFLAVVAAVILLLDAVTKWWAETTLSQRSLEDPSIVLIDGTLTFTLAYNKGGAFGMLSGENDAWRQPFFLIVSIGAVAFIVSLYRKLHPEQHALRWGLPLILGGALGNLADRISKGKVVDFIDYSAGWVRVMNELIAKVNSDWGVSSHWPTFNVADMAICTGIGLMVVDMFTHKKHETNSGDSDSKKPTGQARTNDSLASG